MYPLKTNRDTTTLKWQCKVRNMPKQKLPTIIHGAEWEKVTKGRAGIRWDSVAEKVWKETVTKGRAGIRCGSVVEKVWKGIG